MSIAEKHAFRVDIAREFAVASNEFLNASVTTHDALARFEQARAYLTYMDNIEYTIDNEI
jgi:hypothetical protein